MALDIFQFLSLFLVAFGAGTVFSHVLQIRPKKELEGPLYLRVQTTLYRQYGPAGGTMEGGAFVTTLATALLLPTGSASAYLAWFATLAILATTGIWALWIRPINNRMLGWTAESLSAEWAMWRDRWARLHAIRAVIAALALAALILALRYRSA